MSSTPKNIIFDLDGTLIDSIGITLQLMTDLISQHNGKPIHSSDISAQFGQPEEKIFAMLAGERASEKLLAQYVLQIQHSLPQIVLFKGMFKILTALKANGHRLGLYTARGIKATQVISDHLNLKLWFDPVVTGSDVQKGKPHPEGILKITERWPRDGRLLYYVGDTPHDVVMAKAASAKSVAVSWGNLASHDELELTQPDFILRSVSELKQIFDQ